MSWHRLFTSAVINRGYSYFRDGRVLSVSASGSIFLGQILGSHRQTYRIIADLSDPESPILSCTCPHAAQGARCKHMAALLYAIDARKSPGKKKAAKTKSVKKKTVNPFLSSEKTLPESDKELPAYRSSYNYFDLSLIFADYSFPEEDYQSARKLIENKSVSIEEVEAGYGSHFGINEMLLSVRGIFLENGKNARALRLLLSRSRLIDKICYVPSCGSYSFYNREVSYRQNTPIQQPCVHQLALLLLLQEYLKTNHPGDATDRNASALLSRYRKMRPPIAGTPDPAAPAAMKKVTLLPRFHFYDSTLSVDFKIGFDRLYIIKDLNFLYKTVLEKELYPLGKTASINFSIHDFDEASLGYYDFIRAFLLEQNRGLSARSAFFDAFSESAKCSEISLYGERLDRLYELVQGRPAEIFHFENSARKSPLSLADRNLIPSLTIRDSICDGRFDGITLSGSIPQIYRGLNAGYYLAGGDSENVLCRMSLENLEALLPLLEADDSPEFHFTIGRRNLSDFYYHVLPLLEKFTDIHQDSVSAAEDYLPPEVAFRFYLDAADEEITCRAEALYGEESYPLESIQYNSAPDYGYRDRRSEQEAAAYLEKLFPDYDPNEKLFRSQRSDDAVYKLLENGISYLMTLGEVHSTDRFLALKIRKKWKLSVGVSVKSSLMEVSILSDDLSPKELMDVLKSYRMKKKYHRLKNGDFVDLSNENIDLLDSLLSASHVSPREFVQGKMQIPAYRALYLDKMLEEHEEIVSSRDAHFKNLIRSFKTTRDSDYELPKGLRAKMRPYQLNGFKWLMTVMSFGFGGILADDMGLGKTLQMISVLLAAREEGKTGSSLIVCPASLIYNWLEEFSRFAPTLSVTPVVGSKEERKNILGSAFSENENPDAFVTSYDLLKRDINLYEDHTFAFIVLDEAQYIKNPGSAAAKSVKILKGNHRFALTGTPIENRLSELWSIFDFLMPGFLYGYETFRKELELPITAREDKAAAERLKKMTAPFILRRLKGDVLKDLPEKLEETRYAAFGEPQRKLYDAQVVRMKELLSASSEDEFKKSKIQILAELTHLRQICCDPSLYFDNYRGGSAKREVLLTLVRNAIDSGHRILIFSQFTSMLALIEEDLKNEGIAYFVITGATPKEERGKLVKRFNSGDTAVFLISLKAGGTGLNLTGADVVIHYDPWWNLAVQNQATDRAHRIGQTRVVSVFKLIVKGTIEEKILEMQETKKDLADEILSSENGMLGKLTKDDLLSLLS
ncbi:MAG: DEAD/DEAH box helicase [Lachnospiraceae bacterium]|nr:DEAD/DEAH box helicase [Lachnospiraceae bacterium]